MARIDADDLRDPEPIFVATSLRTALRAEQHLTQAGLDYAVQVEEVGRTLLFRRVRMGAAFYAPASTAAWCRRTLADAGLGAGVIEEPG